MKKIWLWLVVIAVVAGGAVVTHRVTSANRRSSALRNEKADVKTSGSTASGATVPAAVSAVEISQRGPGMQRQRSDALKLLVPRTLDLTHVTAANFATALGDDPARTFNYVRDEIAYETYTGCLRGPRGTLLALAGNSVDRASLLASMLQHAGQRARFAHGTLPEPLARELVTSMWAERPQPAEPGNTTTAAARSEIQTFITSAKRHYALIRDELKKANINPQSAPSLDSLIKEAQDHYWVQWSKDGNWLDLDPSFVDSSPGTRYTAVTETFDALPDAVYHQVEINIRLEEYTGDHASSRVILTRKSKAAELSGVDILVSHQPENWNGPAASLQGALASAIQDTGRIKPVLLIGGKEWAAGEPFYPKSPPTGGMGGVFTALAGIGTRRDAPIATAEWIEFKFDYPDHRSETAVREVFDLLGKAKRSRNETLTANKIKDLTGGDQPNALTTTLFSVFVTTGRLASEHLVGLSAENRSERPEGQKGTVPLRRLALTFYFLSDRLLANARTPEHTVVRFYPDSPRVFISECSARASRVRLAVDLRRDHVRSVVAGANPDSIFAANVLHGVVDGTLERMVVGHVAGRIPRTVDLKTGASTSLLFEQADSQRVPAVLLTGLQTPIDASVTENARTWLSEDLRQGYYALAPQHPIRLADGPRYAWWRIDRQTGETVAVTDEGLYQATTERMFVVSSGDAFDVFIEIEPGVSLQLAEGLGVDQLADFVFEALKEGFEVLGPL